ncbi:unnamed protein product [Symbiodinium natans]|uniref:Uncharacterized protein n=1 Tax=Symbiodinium natans TaxID=878477 RepID=A0A812U9V2_9DINO|nr:unnamed protein product [Symbiodinium natans]
MSVALTDRMRPCQALPSLQVLLSLFTVCPLRRPWWNHLRVLFAQLDMQSSGVLAGDDGDVCDGLVEGGFPQAKRSPSNLVPCAFPQLFSFSAVVQGSKHADHRGSKDSGSKHTKQRKQRKQWQHVKHCDEMIESKPVCRGLARRKNSSKEKSQQSITVKHVRAASARGDRRMPLLRPTALDPSLE